MAVSEHNDISGGIAPRASAFPSGGRTGLVHDNKTQPIQACRSYLRQTVTQIGIVIVAVHADQAPGALLESIEQGDVDPVARVNDHVGTVDLLPHDVGQIPGTLRHMCVGDDQETHMRDGVREPG
jgi:hypothetical protein